MKITLLKESFCFLFFFLTFGKSLVEKVMIMFYAFGTFLFLESICSIYNPCKLDSSVTSFCSIIIVRVLSTSFGLFAQRTVV